MSIKKFYQQDIVDHYQNPRNFGVLPEFDFISPAYNPSCGDAVTICGTVHADTITAISFEGKGCMLMMAMASQLTLFAQGLSLQELLQKNETLVEQILGMQLGIKRMQCGMLPLQALQTGIKLYLEKKS